MLFHYKATDKTNVVREGTIDAATIDLAISSLERRGYAVTAIDPLTQDKSLFDFDFSFLHRISNKDVVIFSRQIATLFEAQVSALRVFRLLAAETDSLALRKVLNEISDDLQGGSSIASSLEQHSDVFSPFYVSMVRAGEEAGKLDQVFLFLADYLDRNYEVMSKARNALIYPAFVIATFVVVMVLMMTMVIPKLSQIIIESGQTVPIFTKIIIGLSTFMTQYFIVFVFLVASGVGALWYFGRTPVGARAYDELRLSVPYLGDLYQKLFLSRIADSLSTMLASGISMVQALEISSQVVGNRVYKEVINDTIVNVKAGRSVSDSFAEHAQIPGVMVQMMKVGEESGNLSSILETLAKFYRREVNGAVDTVVSLIEPAMIVILGVGVAILLSAVLLPIYNIASGV